MKAIELENVVKTYKIGEVENARPGWGQSEH